MPIESGGAPPAGASDGAALAWWHRDSANFHVEIAERAYEVASLVEALGPALCRAARDELRRVLKYSRQFDEIQFADLD